METSKSILIVVSHYTDLLLQFEPVENIENNVPIKTNSLDKIYPNPFSSSESRNSDISISVLKDDNSYVELSVFNIKGQKAKNISRLYERNGEFNLSWNVTDYCNKEIISGVYFVKMEVNGKYIETKNCY